MLTDASLNAILDRTPRLTLGVLGDFFLIDIWTSTLR